MSPSESDLRAALRAGEGDTVDPDSALSAARAARHQRRVRVASAAGAALVVGAIGTGVGLADLHSGAGPAASGGVSGSGSGGPSSSAQAMYRSSTAPAPAQRALGTLTCPASPVRYLLPGGGGTGQFGGSSPLFAAPVAAMKVCMYPVSAGTRPRSFVVQGGDAQTLAHSLNAAPSSAGHRLCPEVMPEDEFSFEILAVTADGAKLRPVVAQPGCQGRITNGSAVRFGWSMPQSFPRLATPQPTR